MFKCNYQLVIGRYQQFKKIYKQYEIWYQEEKDEKNSVC
jgi:hypothetical protein